MQSIGVCKQTWPGFKSHSDGCTFIWCKGLRALSLNLNVSMLSKFIICYICLYFSHCKSAWNPYPNLCLRYREKQDPLKGICNLYEVKDVKRCSSIMNSLLADMQQISVRAGRAASFFHCSFTLGQATLRDMTLLEDFFGSLGFFSM